VNSTPRGVQSSRGDDGPRGSHVFLVVLALFSVPLIFALLPILGLILGTVKDFTTVILGTETGNIQLDALLPWVVMAFVGAAGFIVFYAFVILKHDTLRGR